MRKPSQQPGQPEGQITRGKTAPNRLRRMDHFLAAYDPGLISRRDGEFERAFYVDLGYGSEPVTTMESAARLRKLNRDLPVLGVEIKPERVERARPFADDQTFFRLGGFNLPLGSWPDGQPETVRLVRAFNVLRQYDQQEVLPAYNQIMSRVLSGGLLMDGTSDPFGRVWTANLIRRSVNGDSQDLSLEAVVLGANLGVGFEPEAFQTRLPKSFIHRMVPGDPAFAFIEAFKAAARDTRSSETWGPRAWFTATGGALTGRGYEISHPDRWLRQGWLVWRNPELSL